jgi:2-polyprenyl-6-methoxyphenol hydroxylase-like FAD-dependent oxidoreductase
MTIARRTSIAIIGGGIGGLTAAGSLLSAGFDVQVYEQARALSEVGAGINIGPNASRILHRLGIAEELGRTGVKPVAFDQRRWDDGRVLLRSPLGEAVESAQYCRRMALVFAQTGESDEALKELTETIFHGSVGQRPGFIEDTLRTGHEKSFLRPELGTKRAQNRKPRVLAEDGAETAR